jgi:hypothetical protein
MPPQLDWHALSGGKRRAFLTQLRTFRCAAPSDATGHERAHARDSQLVASWFRFGFLSRRSRWGLGWRTEPIAISNLSLHHL